MSTVSQRLLTSQLRNMLRRKKAAMVTMLPPSDYQCSQIKQFDDIPGPPSVPVLGGLVNHLPFGKFHGKTPIDIYKECRSSYGNIYKEKILHFTFVHIFDPNDFETVFRSDGKYPIREAFLTLAHYNKKYNGGTQGILTSQNESWYELRSQFQQKMLRPKSVSAYFDDQSLVADDLVEKISRSRDGDIVEDIRGDLDKFATECVGIVCFNKRFDLLLSKNKNLESEQFYNAVNVIMDTSHNEFKRIPLYLLVETPSFKKFVKAQNLIKEIAIKYSKSALKNIENQKKDCASFDGEHGDLIPYLMSKTSLTEEQIFNVISELIFVGVDTTSHHLSFMMYLLGTHPEVQDKLYQEISQYVTGEGPVTVTDMGKMSYLKAVDKEVHRLLPVATGTVRTLSQDIELQGYQIPAGTTVAVHQGISGTDPNNFKDAESFKPERWLRSEMERRDMHPFASMPFGFGQRSCIGRRFAEQETFLATIKILQKYQIKYVGEELKLDYGVSVAPGNKLRFQFTPRQTQN